VLALDDVDAEFSAGTFTVVAGPSGSGKTTLLRLVALLDRPEAGHVLLDGIDVTLVSPRERRELRRRQVGYMFQQPGDNLLEYLTAARHVQLGRRIRTQDDADADEPANDEPANDEPDAGEPANDDLLGMLGLAERVEHLPAHLSGGEQQRLALARALARDPAILFLDEPTASLDPHATKTIEDIIRAVSTRGVKVVMSTHDLGQARRLAGDIVLLHRGRLIEAAPVDTFFANPRTQEARKFIAGELLV
jgi:tungstate transport system ATP-binding protein